MFLAGITGWKRSGRITGKSISGIIPWVPDVSVYLSALRMRLKTPSQYHTILQEGAVKFAEQKLRLPHCQYSQVYTHIVHRARVPHMNAMHSHTAYREFTLSLAIATDVDITLLFRGMGDHCNNIRPELKLVGLLLLTEDSKKWLSLTLGAHAQRGSFCLSVSVCPREFSHYRLRGGQ